MRAFHIYVPTEKIAEVESFLNERHLMHPGRIAQHPDGSAVYAIVPTGAYHRHELTQHDAVTVMPHAETPGTIGPEHAKRFAHIPGVHHAMTHYELRAAQFKHHGCPLFDPGW